MDKNQTTDGPKRFSDAQSSIFPYVLFAAGALFVAYLLFHAMGRLQPTQSENCATNTDAEAPPALDGKFVLGDLGIEIHTESGFTYPASLADVEKIASDCGGWLPRPIVGGYALVEQHFNAGTPEKTLAEASKMENTTPETNAQIVGAFERVPPREGMNPSQLSPEVDYEAEYHRHLGADVGSFNPLFFSTSPDLDAIHYTQTSLFNTHFDTLEFVGNADTIVSWESSADHMMDKIVLRGDLLWSDGEPLTAYDWEFSYNVIMSSTVPIFGIRSGTDLLMGCKAYDARTLVFFHQNATPISPQSMSFYIIPKHIYEKTIAADPTLTRTPFHQEQEHNPVTAGPYVVEKHRPNTSIVFLRNENYYMFHGKQVREKPFFKRVHFTISPDSATAFMQMKNGDVETMLLLPELWLTQATTPDFYRLNTKASAPCWTYFALWFNMSADCPFFQDIRVRQALSFAFDYDEMLKVHRKGLDTQCRGLYAETAPFFPKDANLPYLKQDFERAHALLAEAGWSDTNSDGLLDHEWRGARVPFQFTILTTTTPEAIEMGNLFACCMRHLGIDCRVQSIEFNVLCQRAQAHKFQMYLGGWGGGEDPYSSENIWGTNAPRNYMSYSNPKVDELFKKGLQEFDRPKRMEIYKQIHTRIYNDYPCIWLYNRNTSIGFNKKLRGVGFDFSDAFLQNSWKEVQVSE